LIDQLTEKRMNKFFAGLAALVLVVFSGAGMAAEKREDIHDSAELVQPLMVGMKAPAPRCAACSGKIL